MGNPETKMLENYVICNSVTKECNNCPCANVHQPIFKLGIACTVSNLCPLNKAYTKCITYMAEVINEPNKNLIRG